MTGRLPRSRRGGLGGPRAGAAKRLESPAEGVSLSPAQPACLRARAHPIPPPKPPNVPKPQTRPAPQAALLRASRAAEALSLRLEDPSDAARARQLGGRVPDREEVVARLQVGGGARGAWTAGQGLCEGLGFKGWAGWVGGRVPGKEEVSGRQAAGGLWTGLG